MSNDIPPEEGSPSDLDVPEMNLDEDESQELDGGTLVEEDLQEGVEAGAAEPTEVVDAQDEGTVSEAEIQDDDDLEEDEDEEEPRKGPLAILMAGEADLYTVLLGLSLFFVIVSCLFLYGELARYDSPINYWWDVREGTPDLQQ